MSQKQFLWFAVACLILCNCKADGYREVSADLSPPGLDRTTQTGEHSTTALRFSVAAMLSPRNTYAAYSQWVTHMGLQLDMRIDFVQRSSYAEVNQLLASGEVDAALLCTGGYLELKRQAGEAVEVLAVPVVRGKTTYNSLVIVPANSPARSLADLRQERFVFTDELSLSGRAYVVQQLRRLGDYPSRYFRSVRYTHSHDLSIESVASGMADGAAVDSLVYETIATQNPDRISQIRIIDRSPPLGITPVVAGPSLSTRDRIRLRQVLLSLEHDPAAAAAMQTIHIDRFVAAEPGLYDSAIAILGEGR